MLQNLLKLFLQNWGWTSQKCFEITQLSPHDSARVCHGFSATDQERKEALLQRSLFCGAALAIWIVSSLLLLISAWFTFWCDKSVAIPKSPILFNAILYYMIGWSGVDLFSSFEMSSKQQLKYTNISFLLCVMSHSYKNCSQIRTREIYFLRDEQMIAKNTKIEK